MRKVHLLCLPLGAALLGACSTDAPTSIGMATDVMRAGHTVAPPAGKVDVCHRPAAAANILRIGGDGLADHLAHGDYIATLLVSHDPGQPPEAANFTTIGAALAAARASRISANETLTAACRITILVAAGRYEGTLGAPTGMLEPASDWIVLE